MEIYKPLIDEMVWSYSRLEAFDCPYKWYMKYLCKEKEMDMFYSSYGKFMHDLLFLYHSGAISKEDMVSMYYGSFSNEVRGFRPQPSTVEKYIEEGANYIRNISKFDFNIVGVEEKVEFTIGDYKFIGFIDVIGEKDGEYIIVDHKTRAMKQRSNRKKPTKNDEMIDEKLRQLYLYAHAVNQIYGKFPKYLCFNCFRNGEFIKEEFNEDKYKETIEWALKRIEEISNMEDFPPNLDYFACFNICGLHDRCCYFENR